MLVLAAYFAVSTRRLHGDAPAFQLLNLLGALGLTFNAFFYGAFPSIGVNLVWGGIALSTLLRMIKTPGRS